MSSFAITRQDGNEETCPMPLCGWLRITIEAGDGTQIPGTGVFSSSELRSLKLPEFVALAPPPEPPRLKEVEYDISARTSDGVLVGPRVAFRALAHDDPPPEPPAKPTRKTAA